MSEAPEDWDEERPALPVEIPFERELAAIPPGAMQALQEEFLAGLYEPEDEGKVSHAEMVATASKQVREFLLACHGEKWRRQKTSQCYEAIARASLADIGRKALVLMCNGSVPQNEAIALAITQIEAEDYAKLAIRLGGTYEQGIERWRASKQAHEYHFKALARIPKWERQRDENGNLLHVPLEDGLKALFPLTGWKGARRREEQRRRFKDLLIDFALGEHPKVLANEEERERPEKERWERLMKHKIKVGDPVPEGKKIEPLSREERRSLLSEREQEQIRMEAERRLEEMERTGISPVLFRAATLWVAICDDEHIREVRVRASRSGHAAKARKKASREKYSSGS